MREEKSNFSSVFIQNEVNLEPVYTIYAQDSRKSSQQEPVRAKRIVKSSLSFHERSLMSSRLENVTHVLTDELVFEMNRDSSVPADQQVEYLKSAKMLICTQRGFTTLHVTGAYYDLDRFIAAGNRLSLSDFRDVAVKELDLSDNEIANAGMQRDAQAYESGSCALQQHLRSLDLSMNFCHDLGLLLTVISRFRNLRVLRLSACTFSSLNFELELASVAELNFDNSPSALRYLSQLAKILTNLEVLSLCTTRLANQHFYDISLFAQLKQLVIRENNFTREQIKIVLNNIRFEALAVIDIARRAEEKTGRNDYCECVSIDSDLRVHPGRIGGMREVTIVLFDTSRMPQKIRLGGSADEVRAGHYIEDKNVQQFLKDAEMRNRMKQRVPCAQSPNRQIVRPRSNRKHIIMQDGGDYLSEFLRQQYELLKDNSLISEALLKYINSTKAKAKGTSGDILQEHEDAKQFFVTELENQNEEDAQVIGKYSNLSIFDDNLISKELFERLDLVKGPVTEQQLLNHPIDVTGLESFLPRGLNTTTAEAFTALRRLLLNPQSDEKEIYDEELLKILLHENE